MAAGSPIPAPPPPVLRRHLFCLDCTYDLFGQPLNGVCPECGASISELRERMRVWRRRKTPRVGLSWLAAAAGVGVLGTTFVLGGLVLENIPYFQAVVGRELVEPGLGLLALSYPIFLMAAWLLGRQPRWMRTAPRGGILLRIAVVLPVLSICVIGTLANSGFSPASNSWLTALAILRAILPLAAFVAAPFLALAHVARFAAAAGDRALGGRLWIALILGAASTVVLVIALRGIYSVLPPLMHAALLGPPAAGLLGALLMIVFNIDRADKAMRRVIRSSLDQVRTGG